MADPIISANGVSLMGRADESNRLIQIAGDVPPEQRLDVLLHELQHCWLFHVPPPRNEEELCNLNAMIGTSAMRDLAEQGGAEALEKMKPWRLLKVSAIPPEPVVVIEPGDDWFEPTGQIEQAHSKAPARAGRAQCECCETIVTDGAIVTMEPEWDYLAGGLVVSRTLYCPHCHALQSWVEGYTKGAPNGSIVSGPTRETQSALVRAFLAEHPESVGLLPA